MMMATVVPYENPTYQLIESRKRPFQQGVSDDEAGDRIEFKRERSADDTATQENNMGGWYTFVIYIYIFSLIGFVI